MENQNILMEKLDFGRDSAESEQEFLEKVFVPTPVFKRVKNGQKTLVLGRKGSGKTALRIKLFNELKQNSKVSLITPKSLSKLKNSMIEKSSLNKLESSLLSWKYVFLTELGMYILEAAKKEYGDDRYCPECVKRVQKYIATNAEKKENWIDKAFKIIRLIKEIEISVVKIKTDESSASKSEDISDFSDDIDKISNVFIQAMKDVIKSPIFILIDQVDDIWEPTEESKALIIGLLRAAKELGEENTLIKFIIFLRSDIFDFLDFHDSDKFHSIKELITWNKSDLKRMLSNRIKISTGLQTNSDSFDETWNTFFPSYIDGIDSFEYILQYTLMRPRDFIQLCNYCRDKAQNNGNIKIEKKEIEEALPQFSEWKLKDLRDEYLVQYPFLEQVFLSMFYKVTPRMSREDVIGQFNIVKDNILKKFDYQYLNSIDNLLQILYNIGFLGVVSNSITVYSFQDSKTLTPYSSMFEIHPVFRPALSISSNHRPIKIGGNVSGSNIISGNNNVISVAGNMLVGKSNKVVVSLPEADLKKQ